MATDVLSVELLLPRFDSSRQGPPYLFPHLLLVQNDGITAKNGRRVLRYNLETPPADLQRVDASFATTPYWSIAKEAVSSARWLPIEPVSSACPLVRCAVERKLLHASRSARVGEENKGTGTCHF
jgi:hypothetical protein